jgi:GT2 family glycosyltransferase
MLDGSPDEGEPVDVDLARGEFAVLFSEPALRSSSHLNFYRDGRIALHVKYIPMRGGFVLNDFADGAWGEQIFVDCLIVPGSAGLHMTLAAPDDGPEIRFRGAPVVTLGDRFDLGGTMTARLHPSIIRNAPEGRGPRGSAASLMPSVIKMTTIEAANLELGVDVTVTTSSAFFIEGWIDDRRSRLVGVSMVDYATGLRAQLPIGRVRRQDVDTHLQAARPGEFGFWVAGLGGAQQLSGAALSLVLEDGSGVPLEPKVGFRRSELDFFEFLLASFGRRSVLGNITVRSFSDLEAGYGDMLGKLYRQIATERRVTSHARFGRRRAAPSLSMVCVLFGYPDFLYLLVSQFARFGSLEGIEFIFVNNSPELEEVLMRDAELASFVFGAEIQVLSLNQNSGFSHANNVGVGAARSGKIVIINPDVFPRHKAAVDHLRGLCARDLGRDIYGGKLYYADGSVMHEGMYFTQDRKLSVMCDAPIWTVEHFRKGFADTSSPAPRDVPAVTGALMVMERHSFERLGGFNVDFIFGHYEDADLCLRIQEAGGRVILDPGLAYWHYEGMGSTKRPEHIGSNMYNRWHFARLWGHRITEQHEHG